MTYEQLEKKIIKTLEKLPQVEQQAADPNLPKNVSLYRAVMQEHSQLIALRQSKQDYDHVLVALKEAETLKNTAEQDIAHLAEEEMLELTKQKALLWNTLQELVIPTDPLDSKNIIVEIRAGTGGEEAGLFVTDLFRMYSKYAETQKWKIEIINSNPTGIGGYKEIVFSISGSSYGVLKYESGGHRVQRIPTTESGGRIHTSAVTVAVLPEVEETEIEIKSEDLRVDVFRSSGPGGQSVNTTDSAVRITHLPTGLVISCQDEKSQHKNKAKALRVLRARLTALEEERKQAERASERRSQIGSGDRSERIRTYNFPQNRVTDHRIHLTLYHLDRIMEGDMQELLGKLKVELNVEAG